MKILSISFLFLLVTHASPAQDNDRVYGIIKPNESMKNNTDASLYYMDYQTIKKYLDLETMHKFDSMKLEMYEAFVQNFSEQKFLYDSLNRLGRLEADYWHDLLLSTDMQLQEAEKEVVILQNKNQNLKRSRMYFFIFGALAGFFGWATLN